MTVYGRFTPTIEQLSLLDEAFLKNSGLPEDTAIEIIDTIGRYQMIGWGD